ncbi:MAG: holo-ACP synthase [Oscillochloridaceae bacterium umkhey_bin13]
MIYHGIDLVEIKRVRCATERWGGRFLERIFTPGELVACAFDTLTPRYDSLAARWAAKEAAAKALGLGLSGLTAGSQIPLRFHEVEVARGPAGRPLLLLHGRAAEVVLALDLVEIALSLSHTREYAMASVVALARE